MVFTGNGKGKTTAALGQAMRALGQNKKVLIIQFIKGPWKSGEDNFVEKLNSSLSVRSKFQIRKTGKGFVGILGDSLPLEKHQEAAQEGLKLAEQAIKSKKYNLVVLDEINNAVDLKLLKTADVLNILKSVRGKEFAPDLILTGRNAPLSFIKIADIVTEMREVKHIFNRDKHSAKRGIEF